MSEDTRTRINRAAATLFFTHGYKKTTLRMIGDLVGISHVSVLRYFKNKNELAAQTVVSYIAGLEKLCYQILEEVPADLADAEYCRHMIWWTMHYRLLSLNPTFREFYITFWGEEQTVISRRTQMPGPEALKFIQISPPKAEALIYGSLSSALDSTIARLIGMKALSAAKATKLIIQQIDRLDIDLSHLPDEAEILDFEQTYLPKRKIDLLNEILLVN